MFEALNANKTIFNDIMSLVENVPEEKSKETHD